MKQMKQFTRFVLLCLFLTSSSTQAQIAAWDFSGQPGDQATSPATTTDVNLTVGSISRGSGLNPSALGNAFSSTTNGTSMGDGFTATSLANAIAQNAFLQFTIKANTGFSVSLSTLNANFRRSSTGPTNFQWQYSLDGFATAGVNISSPINFTSTATNGVAQLAIDLSTITALQNVSDATTITIRLYGWNATGLTGTFALGRLPGDDLAIDGTVTPAGPPDFTGGATIAPGTYNNVTLDQNCTISPAGNVTVNGVLNLGGFRLNAGTNLVIVNNDDELAIVATPGVGRVNGTLRRAIIAPSLSARTYAFPLGDATRNRGVIVGFASTTGTFPTLTAVFDGTNPGTGGIGSLTPTVVNVWPGGFWRVSQSGLTTTAYSIALSTDGVDGILAPSTVRIIKRPDAATNWAEAVVSTPVTLTGLTGQQASFTTGFSEFGFGGAGDNPLPVELSSFTGSATAAGVNLRWTTQSELNNAGFAVFRNGVEIASYRFSPALRGKGTTTGATNYAFLDAGVEVGQRYTYRLRSFDLDGTIHDYPQTVSVEVREPISQRVFNYDLSQNFPNPFNPTTSIKYSIREAGNVSLKVYDLLGREVLTLVNQVQAPGEYQVSFDASSLTASGMYIYRLQSGNFTRTMKMLLVK